LAWSNQRKGNGRRWHALKLEVHTKLLIGYSQARPEANIRVDLWETWWGKRSRISWRFFSRN
jgi:hypothetical protein